MVRISQDIQNKHSETFTDLHLTSGFGSKGSFFGLLQGKVMAGMQPQAVKPNVPAPETYDGKPATLR